MRTIKGVGVPSMRLVFSYVFDWICIIAIAAIGAGWEYIFPYNRPFSLVNLDISYPFQHHERIPTFLLIIIALIAPAAIIMFVCLVFVPGPTAERGTPKALIWRRKLWEWNTGWMGLALSLAMAFLVTQGMKLLFGKPRPDFLSRCNPDLDRIEEFAITSVAKGFNSRWVMVTSGICRNPDRSRGGELMDGFKSFPSGHASFSWAGLFYLSLFLASKFSVAIPFLPPRPFSTNPAYTSAIGHSNLKKQASMTFHKQESSLSTAYNNPAASDDAHVVPIRYQNAAPPVYTLALPFVPIAAAIYVCSTRFTDFRHFGFDLLFGSFIGLSTSYLSFRFYHLPITRGAGWAWGPRSYDRAFGIGVGRGSYVGTEGWSKSGRSETVATGVAADEAVLRPVVERDSGISSAHSREAGHAV